jgi:FMN phosphatase YigB (HAD superfamily)
MLKSFGAMSGTAVEIVSLIDVDNTLLDNDRVEQDLRHQLERDFGPAAVERYWAILSDLWDELGYRDYLGALQRYRIEHPLEPHLLEMSSYLIEYPFANRLFPGSLDTLDNLARFGPTVILSDGDVVFQPRKVQRSGLWEAVDGRVLIYIHKEQMLGEVERHHPARHYVMIDDKLRILAAMKRVWTDRLTTVFPRQGHYALDPQIVATNPPADVSIERIGDLVGYDLTKLLGPSRAGGTDERGA